MEAKARTATTAKEKQTSRNAHHRVPDCFPRDAMIFTVKTQVSEFRHNGNEKNTPAASILSLRAAADVKALFGPGKAKIKLQGLSCKCAPKMNCKEHYLPELELSTGQVREALQCILHTILL